MELTRDIIACAAICLIGIGCWLVHPPLAMIAVGVILLGGIVVGSKRIERKRNDSE